MEIEMPKYVDSQVQVLWWEADQFSIAIAILGTGLMLGMFIIPMVILFITMPVVTKLKNAALDGAAHHLLCTTGIIPLNKEFDDSLEKDFYL